MNEWMNAWVFLPSSIALRPNILHCMKRNKMRESYCNRDYFDCLFTPGLCLLLWTTYLIGQQCLCTQRWLFLFCKFQSYLFWISSLLTEEVMELYLQGMLGLLLTPSPGAPHLVAQMTLRWDPVDPEFLPEVLWRSFGSWGRGYQRLLISEKKKIEKFVKYNIFIDRQSPTYLLVKLLA